MPIANGIGISPVFGTSFIGSLGPVVEQCLLLQDATNLLLQNSTCILLNIENLSFLMGGNIGLLQGGDLELIT